MWNHSRKLSDLESKVSFILRYIITLRTTKKENMSVKVVSVYFILSKDFLVLGYTDFHHVTHMHAQKENVSKLSGPRK